MNTTPPDLSLANGAVSSVILKAGGSSLQDECNAKYPAGIKCGNVARTGGHGLDCKEVFHVTLCGDFTHDGQNVRFYCFI